MIVLAVSVRSEAARKAFLFPMLASSNALQQLDPTATHMHATATIKVQLINLAKIPQMVTVQLEDESYTMMVAVPVSYVGGAGTPPDTTKAPVQASNQTLGWVASPTVFAPFLWNGYRYEPSTDQQAARKIVITLPASTDTVTTRKDVTLGVYCTWARTGPSCVLTNPVFLSCQPMGMQVLNFSTSYTVVPSITIAEDRGAIMASASATSHVSCNQGSTTLAPVHPFNGGRPF